MNEPVYDLLIAGGGINGAGIAADAAGRGLKVLLAEMGDLAGATSSASSKLIHGGLRYLEHWEFRLVRESLLEREVLLGRAPHIIHPLRFVLPHVEGMRPRLLIRTGLAFYDHLAERRRIPASSSLDLTREPSGRPLRSGLAHGFAYWDCWVDDARLVVLNALAAREKGAEIHTRTRVSQMRPAGGLWHVTLIKSGLSREVSARAVVNATGPWAGDLARLANPTSPKGEALTLRLVKGSHIVVPRIRGAEDAYLLQAQDGRVVFALPFEDRFTLIGTTDVPYTGDPASVAVVPEEEDYLLALAGKFFASPPSKDDIVWRFAGVRPLLEDGSSNPSAVSRDYRLDLVQEPGMPPLLNVIGGKITTYRRLAESALAKLAAHFPAMGPAWTRDPPLPGGDVGERGIDGYRLDLARRHSGIPAKTLSRYVRLYGTRAGTLLGDTKSDAGLGPHLGGGLHESEVRYLKKYEWACEPEDVLWRRTKAGLHMSTTQRQAAEGRIAAILA